MAKKLSELDHNNRIYFEALMDFMNETWQNDFKQRLKVAQKFGLDLTDDEVLELLAPMPNLSDGTANPLTITKRSVKTEPQIAENHAVTTKQTQQATKIYGEQWIVIQNRLLNAISHLDLNERRLIMFLSPIVRKAVDINPKERIFKAQVIDFVNQYGIKSKKYYGEFEKIADSILDKVFFFWEDYKKTRVKVGVNWVSECRYLENEGTLEIKLDDRVIEMLTIFDKNNPFTKYQREMIINLGGYGIILFELIASCMHQEHKQKAYTIEYLREKFNCVETYPTFYDFKRYVLDKAVKDIEKHTPYHIKYTQKKDKRTVTEIVFSFEDTIIKGSQDKKQKGVGERDPNTIDWVNGATDNEIKLLSQKQADYFASKLANNTNFGSKFAKIGEDSKPFISRISKELQRDISKVSSYMPYLISEGYSPTN